LNAFSVLAAAYGFVGALSQVAGKVALNQRARKKGLLVNPNPKWWIDKEASSDLIDIYTFIVIGTSFIFVIFAEFTAYTDWFTATMSNVFAMAAVCVSALSTFVIESEIRYADGRTWNRIWIEPKTENLMFGLTMLTYPWGIVYLLINRPVSDWVSAGLVVPQFVLVFSALAVWMILPRIEEKLPPPS
jgi:hypothetical protein